MSRFTGRATEGRYAARLLVPLAMMIAAAASVGAYGEANRDGMPGLDSGAEIYAHVCQGCHMPEGRGAVGAGHYPKLAGDPALASWQYIAITVLNGRKAMPAFGTWAKQGKFRFSVHLSDAQVADVVNYVRTHFGNHWSGRISAAQIAPLPHPADPSGD